MAGPLDILRSIAGTGQGGRAPSPALPAYSAKDAGILKDVEKRMKNINAAVKKGASNWNQMADARALEGARKALKGLKTEQKAFNAVMRDGNATLEDRIEAYNKLADIRQKTTKAQRESAREFNENRGAAGRLKNVLDDLARHKGPALLAAAVKDLTLVFGDANKSFDIMARTGQLTDRTFGGLAKTTGMFSMQMRLAMIQASAMGIAGDDSNKAFAQLTETFGGTVEVAGSLRANWFEMAKLARVSGLGMTDMANLADQGYKRLGESVDTTMNNIVAMSKVTHELNGRFGKGSVNTREFANAVNTLAYSTGFYNQNTRVVIESLGREISAQLALGKSRTAATESAVTNLKMAGQVNIVGIDKFRQELIKQYNATEGDAEARAALITNMTERFGSEGELIVSMMEKGRLQTGKGLFAFQDIVKNSSALSASMLESMRVMALSGPSQLLAMGVDFNRALRMEAESNLMADKLQSIARGGTDKLFTGDIISPEQSALIRELRDNPTMSREGMLRRFYATGGSVDAAKKAMGDADITTGEPEWKDYVSGDGVGWFLGVTNVLGLVRDALTKMPVALGLVIAGLMSRGALGKMISGGLGGGKMTRGLGGMAKTLGPIAVMTAQAFAWKEGWSNAAEIMGRSADAIGPLERIAAGASNAVSQLTFGLVDAGRLARGETALQRALMPGQSFGEAATPEEKMKQEFEHSKKMGWTQATNLQEFSDERSAKRAVHEANMASATQGAAIAVPSQGKGESPKAGATPAPAGGAIAKASISQGHLILDVVNWEDVLAQSQYAQVSYGQ